jgi:hypothetical protein
VLLAFAPVVEAVRSRTMLGLHALSSEGGVSALVSTTYGFSGAGQAGRSYMTLRFGPKWIRTEIPNKRTLVAE